MCKVSYKTKLLFATEEDKCRLLEVLKMERHAFNECSKQIFVHKNLSISFIHENFYSFYRFQNPKVPSQVVNEAERMCKAAYQSIKSNKHKITKPVVKKNLSVQFTTQFCTIKNKKLYLTSAERHKQIPVELKLYKRLQYLLDNYHFAPPKISYKNKKFWCSLVFDIPELPFEKDNQLAVGIDRGYKNIAATSEGRLYKDKKYLKERRRIRYNKRCLQSKGTKSARKHLKKLKNKEKNHSLNQIHHLANNIIKDTRANVLVFEKLNTTKVKSLSWNQNRASQIPIYLLLSMVSYKALLHGKKVIQVPAHYTSQIDHRTGLKDGKRLGGRYYAKDGKVLHADINAACNIALRSKLPCSIGNYYTGQVVMGQPIVCQSN